MAKPSLQLIDALKKAANRIADDKDSYNWKAIGACNCGNLVQEVTNFTAKEISNFGIKKHGDWQSISLLYDKNSGYEIDNIISQLLDMGLDLEDFTYLENLSCPKVLAYIGENIVLKRDDPDDAVLYLNSWANMLEEELIQNISIELVETELSEV
jgi:hypothetical protein